MPISINITDDLVDFGFGYVLNRRMSDTDYIHRLYNIMLSDPRFGPEQIQEIRQAIAPLLGEAENRERQERHQQLEREMRARAMYDISPGQIYRYNRGEAMMAVDMVDSDGIEPPQRVEIDPSMYERWTISPPVRSSFQSGRTCSEAQQLDVWRNEKGSVKAIDKMTKRDLKNAVKQLEDGWTCAGQQHKIVSLKRVLKEKYNV